MPNTTASTLSDATGQKILNALSSGVFASSTSRNIGELVFSSLPLVDAGLVLADGNSEGLSRGAYADFYDYVLTQKNLGSSAVLTKADWDTEKAANNGIIGKYGIDTSAQKVYVPNLMDTFIEGTTSELGLFKAAGVPDIWGGVGQITYVTSGKNYGAFTEDTTRSGVANGSWASTKDVIFHASDGEIHKVNGSNVYRNDVYGKSDTVQPQAIKQYIYIVVANSYKSPAAIDIDNVRTDIASINDSIADLDDRTTWKAVVTNQTGSASIALPSGWKEMLARIHIAGIASSNFDYTFHVIKEFCSTNGTVYFRSGQYAKSSEYTSICFAVSNATSCYLDDAYYNGVDYESTSLITVYYR